jgi:two-component system, chemotaxis family, protein-glutamate methylesterase/glutaminase
MLETNKKIRLLIIDESQIVRDILTKKLAENPSIEIAEATAEVFQSRDWIAELQPDVVLLDIEMKKINGIEFLRTFMPQFAIPVIVFSSTTQKGKHNTLQALESGAIDFIPKPAKDIARGLEDMMEDLILKIKTASIANVSQWKNRKFDIIKKNQDEEEFIPSEYSTKVIAIGASTGGTEALRKLLCKLPVTMPGIVVVQHMYSGFTKTFADRLNELCPMQVKEAETGDKVLVGRVLIAPCDFHMKIRTVTEGFQVHCESGEKVNGHRPSVEILMMSVAEHAGPHAIGIILTGMGTDGAVGLKAMKNTGARTIAQDASTSVVFEMPKNAFEMDCVDTLLPLEEIPDYLIKLVNEMN